MSPSSTKVSPPNSLVFLSDADGGEAPVPVWGAIILSTPSCVSIACYPEQDGPTEIVLGRAAKVAPDDRPAFEDDLEAPSGKLIVWTVDRDVILQCDVLPPRVRVQVWLSHPRWPERVVIGWS
jgi:hypothetical protein